MTRPSVPAGHHCEEIVHDLLAVQAAEGEGEHLRADQHEHHRGRDAARGVNGVDQRAPREPPSDAVTRDAAKRAHGGRSVGAAIPPMMEPQHRKHKRDGGKPTLRNLMNVSRPD